MASPQKNNPNYCSVVDCHSSDKNTEVDAASEVLSLPETLVRQGQAPSMDHRSAPGKRGWKFVVAVKGVNKFAADTL